MTKPKVDMVDVANIKDMTLPRMQIENLDDGLLVKLMYNLNILTFAAITEVNERLKRSKTGP